MKTTEKTQNSSMSDVTTKQPEKLKTNLIEANIANPIVKESPETEKEKIGQKIAETIEKAVKKEIKKQRDYPQIQKGTKGFIARKFTKKVLKEIAILAFEGCQVGTIANATGIPENTLRDNLCQLRGFIPNIKSKRKIWLRRIQNRQAENSTTMSKWLGMNELGQSDKHDIKAEAVPVEDREVPEETLEAFKKAGSAICTE